MKCKKGIQFKGKRRKSCDQVALGLRDVRRNFFFQLSGIPFFLAYFKANRF